MGRIERAEAAKADLLTIWLYIADDSTEVADRVLDRLGSAFVTLSENPRMGRGREEVGSDLRSFVVSSFTVFYVPLDDGVSIARVLHNRQDVERVF